MKWIELPLNRVGEAASKARLEKVPETGPFFIVNQFDADRFERMWPDVEPRMFAIKDSFELWKGSVTYYLTISGHVMKAGYYFDTSD